METRTHPPFQRPPHRQVVAVDRLADQLREATAMHGCSGPIIPLTSVATATLILGAPSTVRSMFLRRLADPTTTQDTRLVWAAAGNDYPYLTGALGRLIGWLDGPVPDHEARALANCFTTLTGVDLLAAADAMGGDLLGPVYSLLRGGYARQQAGAFYTPPDLGRLLATISGPRPGDRVYEPACGSGGMVLAAVRHMRGRGLDPNSCTWTLNDLDPLAVALAAVNMAAHGVRTVILTCRDALTDTGDAGAAAPRMARHGRCSAPERAAEPSSFTPGQGADGQHPARRTGRRARLISPDHPDDLLISEALAWPGTQ